jgi:hypothetical protein
MAGVVTITPKSLAVNGWIIYILRGEVCYHGPVSDEIVFDEVPFHLERLAKKQLRAV